MIVVREPPAPRVSGDDISPMYIGATQINNPSVIPARNLATYSSQIDVAIVIKLQLTKSGKALNNRVFFLPNLSTIKILIGGANICPTATTATNVEIDDAVTGIGESSDINITILGEFHPTTNPMQPLIMEHVKIAKYSQVFEPSGDVYFLPSASILIFTIYISYTSRINYTTDVNLQLSQTN